MTTRRTRAGSSNVTASRKNSKSAPSATSDGENEIAAERLEHGNDKKVGKVKTKANATTAAMTATTKTKKAAGRKKAQTFCLCHGKDDGSPMIHCEGGCSNWYEIYH